jgi:pyruvate,orthophosphate dikinase
VSATIDTVIFNTAEVIPSARLAAQGRSPDWRRLANELFLPRLVNASATPLLSGVGAYPGAVCGHLVMRGSAFEALRWAAAEHGISIPIVFAVDDGSADDGEILAHAVGLISSGRSPNAWCAVQAKSEGIPAVIGVKASFNPKAPVVAQRTLAISTEDGREVSLSFEAQTIEVTTADGRRVLLREGDSVTLDGASGGVYVGEGVENPPARQAFYLLADMLEEALERFGPVDAWTRIAQTETYRAREAEFEALVRRAEFLRFCRLLGDAKDHVHLTVMGCGNTSHGAILARLFFADYSVDANGRFQVLPTTALSGVGLLRTERSFRGPRELNALRALIIGENLCNPSRYQAAREIFAEHQQAWLRTVLRANSGCPTVVRALCMPLNKLFPVDLDLSELCREYGIDEGSARQRIEQNFREVETFHGCRGARLHMLRPDLTKLEIEGILRAGADVMAQGGQVDVSILVATVTFPEEIAQYIEWYDGVYDRLLAEGLRLPSARLSTMIETSAAYHSIERFFDLRGRHIALKGCLFGCNDLTAATLNLNRTDAVRTVIPRYIDLGILPGNPFATLHVDTVGRVIIQGLERIRAAAPGGDLLIGVAGEQAADLQTVRWLAEHAAPKGLDYVAASGDMILGSLMESATVGRDIAASSADIAALLSRGELRSAVVAAAKE